jgi:two-component system chemotaxis sensor kinase CheA
MAQNDTYSMIADPEMREILESFLVETKEILEKLDLDLVELEKNSKDEELLNQIFRSFHTIKGTSGFLGLEKLTLITHKCEDILNKLRKKEAVLNMAVMDGILLSYDKIKEIVVNVEANLNEDVEINDVVEALTKIINNIGKNGESVSHSAEPVSHSPKVENQNKPEVKKENKTENKNENKIEIKSESKSEKKATTKTGNKTKNKAENKSKTKTGNKTKNKVETKSKTGNKVKNKAGHKLKNKTRNEVRDKNENKKEIIEIIEEVIEEINEAPVETIEIVNEIPSLEIVAEPAAGIVPVVPAVRVSSNTEEDQNKEQKKIKIEDNSIRVDVERLDDLLNIVSELVLGRNRLAQVYSEFALEYEGTKYTRDLSDVTKQIDLMTNELQLVVMKTRMVKIGKVFNRFPRLVRDLSKGTGKKINLVIKGEETELDKTLIEEINDPLVHLIRNSVDHAIENPEERVKNGKDTTGTVTLSAEQEGNNIVIKVEDDGKGINLDVIKEKAVSKGLITKEKAKEMSKQDAYNLIFLPGFSTAEKVTNISGRGVGMDVVKTNVTKLRGIINIESEIGKGTKIVIKLPLTLAIIPGMIVKVNNETLVIPLNSVIEVVRVHSDNISTINKHEVIRMRDNIIPLIETDELIYSRKKETNEKVWQYVVVVGIAEKVFGIKVDEMVGQKEVVIKSMGDYLGSVEGIAGSTILGDGTVVMILDISELLNKIEE